MYTDRHETDIIAVISDGKTYCVDHAVEVLFAGDIEAFEEVDYGRDLSFKDVQGDPFDLVHETSITYADSNESFYPDGLTCDYPGCEATLVEPVEEEE